MNFFTHKKCFYCGSALTVHQQVSGGVCGNPECKREKAIDDAHKVGDNKALQLKRHVAQLFEQFESNQKVDPTVITVLPANVLTMKPVEHARKEKFLQHLNKIGEELANSDLQSMDQSIDQRKSDEKELSVEENQLLGKACATCKGFCCVTAGEANAFLTAKILRRYWRNNPSLSNAELVGLYASYIKPESIEKSCLYHSDTGCCLPRDMRANICNEYLCPELKVLQTELKQSINQNVFAAATQNQKVIRANYYNLDQFINA